MGRLIVRRGRTLEVKGVYARNDLKSRRSVLREQIISNVPAFLARSLLLRVVMLWDLIIMMVLRSIFLHHVNDIHITEVCVLYNTCQ